MKRTKAEMKSQSFTCSNPECGRAFVTPIIVEDLSSKNGDSYRACPYCLTEIVIKNDFDVKIKTRERGKEKTDIEKMKVQLKKVKIRQPDQQSSQKENECPHYFGYLSERSKKENIPEKCMTCNKLVQCMLKKVTS